MKTDIIPDVAVRRLTPQGDLLVLLRAEDHVLRRFGQAEFFSLPAGSELDYRLRDDADEYVAILRGAAALELLDTRLESPAYQMGMKIEESAPFAVLVPWGVAVRFHVAKPIDVVRFSTHSSGEGAERSRWTEDELRSRGGNR
ncbi:MAG: hypothetical protein HYZ26_10260 [Chloroflexi bacterium]|nr:hypothetical protein [Chloroflexota bacterium]